MTRILLALAVILAGAGTAIQTGMNAQLRASLGHGLFGALVNFVVGLACLVGLILLLRIPWPSSSTIGLVPNWAWFGGVLGACFIAILASAGRELGATFVVALVVAGQLLTSLALDHFGWLGFPTRPLSLYKIVASLLLIGSLVLFKRG